MTRPARLAILALALAAGGTGCVDNPIGGAYEPAVTVAEADRDRYVADLRDCRRAFVLRRPDAADGRVDQKTFIDRCLGIRGYRIAP